MSQVLVSVIMGTYNPDCEKLKKSVESIITQTYTNWELLLYDDGSEKNTAGNIRKSRKHCRGKIYLHVWKL